MSTWFTFLPLPLVWSVVRWPPRIPATFSSTWSMPFARTTPWEPVSSTVPLPRPPAWIWAFTTNHVVPVSSVSFWAAGTAASMVSTTIPSCTATPYFLRIAFPWNSCRFILSNLRRKSTFFSRARNGYSNILSGLVFPRRGDISWSIRSFLKSLNILPNGVEGINQCSLLFLHGIFE